ncbi:MAG TPA: hypothetical protein VLV87_01565 [Gammaproteobacteria bacterium]|nr:hypothetical protein [Gammaproteobacteria bacterium]
MKNIHRIPAMILGVACIATMGGALADARTNAYDEPGDIHVGVNVFGDSSISMDGDDVLIKGRDGGKARITPAGDLSIDGRTVAVDAGERKLLVRYSLGIRNIERRGMQIGRDALHLVGGIMGTVVADLFSEEGVDDKRIDRDAEQKAEPLKQEARALCKDVQSERQVQADIVSQLPAFRPYAVIDTESDHDCHVDDNDIEV